MHVHSIAFYSNWRTFVAPNQSLTRIEKHTSQLNVLYVL
jgi:hypothetical protein